MRRLIGEARRLMPDVGIQVPPNLADWWPELVARGRERPRRTVGERRSHLARACPSPRPQGPRAPAARRATRSASGCACTRATSTRSGSRRRCWTRSRRATGASSRDAARAAASRPAPIRADLVAGAVARAREGVALSRDELTAMFAETRPEAIEEMREAADELRSELAGETVTFVVNRNINVSNICTVGCAFCGFGQGRRSPDAYEHDARGVRAPNRRGARVRRYRAVHPVGHPPGLDARGLPRRGCAWRRRRRPQLHLHAYSPMEIAHMCDISELAPAEVFERLREAGLGSTPGTAAEVLHDGVRERISPNKLPVARWVEIIEASHRAGLRSTATVMFGHIEEPWELAEHMRVVRELQERTGGITEFVPLSFIPFQTLLGRTHGVQEISSRGEPQAHRDLPPRARAQRAQRAGELGEDGPGGAARGASLGRERPRRHAHGGVDQPPRGQLPRHAPRALASSSPRRTRRAARRRSARRCMSCAATTRCASGERCRLRPEGRGEAFVALRRARVRRARGAVGASGARELPVEAEGDVVGHLGARASSLRSRASSTSRNELPARGVEHDRQQHAVVLVARRRAARRTPARRGSSPSSRPAQRARRRRCRPSRSARASRSRPAPLPQT